MGTKHCTPEAIFTNSDDEDNDDEILKDLECCICKQIYMNPVRNIYNQTYCYHCIVRAYDDIKENQSNIKDPLTNQPLPHHCRLLIPYFSKMVEISNHKFNQYNKQISAKIHDKLKSFDNELNQRRNNILTVLQHSQKYQVCAAKLVDQMMKSETEGFLKQDFDDVIDNALSCDKYFHEIRDLIQKASNLYNNTIKSMDIDQVNNNNNSFEWKDPNWKNHINKHSYSIDWEKEYQIDEVIFSEITEKTRNVLDAICQTIEKQRISSLQELKNVISNILLIKQKEIITEYKEEEEMKNEVNIIEKNNDYLKVKMRRIYYKENNIGLVNTECIKEIAECIKANQPFELYHNDLNYKTMNKNQLVRFLETAGMNGLEQQHYIYDSFAMGLKHKLFRLSSYLKTLNDEDVTYFPYFKYLKSVEITELPVTELKDPENWMENNDKIEMNIKLDVQFDQHLEKYNGSETKLAEEIKRQIIKHLKLKISQDTDKENVVVAIKKDDAGHIEVTFILGTPLLLTSDFCGSVKQLYSTKHNADAWYKAMIQSMIGGGGIGGIMGLTRAVAAGSSVAATTAATCSTGSHAALLTGGAITTGAIAIGPIGWILIGVAVGIVIAGLIGYAVYKYSTAESDLNQNQNNGTHHQYSVTIENVANRIRQNCANEVYKIILDCHCEIDHQDADEQTGKIYCRKCSKWSFVHDISRNAGEHSEQGVERSLHTVTVIPKEYSDEFDV